jgi:hypothetical protein
MMIHADTVAFDTAGDPPAAPATGTGIQFDTAAVMPAEQDILVPGSSGVDRRRLSDFSLVRTYPVTWNGYSEAVSADGSHVAIASNVYTRPGTPADVWVFFRHRRRVALPRPLGPDDAGDHADSLRVAHEHRLRQADDHHRPSVRVGHESPVTIWKQSYGGRAKPVASGNVGGTGAFSATVAPKKNTTYWCTGRRSRPRIGAAFQDKDHGPGGTAWSYLRVTR